MTPPTESLDCIPYFEDADRLTGESTVAEIKGKRFVAPSANLKSGPGIPETAQIGASDPTDGGNIQLGYAPAGGQAIGVSSWSALQNEKLGIISGHQVVPVTVAEAILFGERVQVGTEGRAVKFTTGVAVGVALTGQATVGADAMIKLMV